jgi:branched-chain amino acid transport system permease protein
VAGGEILQFLVAGLKNGAIYALIALGFTVVYASTQVINFAQGEFYMLGGMLGVFFFASAGLPLPLAAVASVVATAAVGVIFEVLAVRPRKDADPLAIIIITVGGSLLLRSLARHLFGPDELSLPPFTAGPSLSVFGASVEIQALWLWGLAIVAFLAFWFVYRRTWFGRAMRAASIDRDAARLMGVDTAMVVTFSFGLAAALGAVAGVAVTPMTQTSFQVGASIGLKGFAAAILGGLGDPVAAVAGGLLLGLIEAVSIAVLPSEFKDAVALIVLLAVLFIRPQGLFGGRAGEKV